LVLGLVKAGATLGVGYIAISAAAAISVETAGVLVLVLVVFAFLCFGLPFLYDVLKSWKDQLTSQIEQTISGQ